MTFVRLMVRLWSSWYVYGVTPNNTDTSTYLYTFCTRMDQEEWYLYDINMSKIYCFVWYCLMKCLCLVNFKSRFVTMKVTYFVYLSYWNLERNKNKTLPSVKVLTNLLCTSTRVRMYQNLHNNHSINFKIFVE